jgi:endoglucanase
MSSRSSRVAVVVALLVAFGGCVPKRSAAQAVPHAIGKNPFDGEGLYVDPGSSAKRQADAWRSTRPEDAAALDKIAKQPQAEWFGEWSGDIKSAARARMSAITSVGALPVFIVYDVPDRDCGQYSAGGAQSSAAYLRWIAELAAGIGERKAVLILEPDLLGQLEKCGSRGPRVAMIEHALRTLKAQPQIVVYLDAGNPSWVPAGEMARRLLDAGVKYADGFSLNVSNYISTADCLTYGKDLSARVGGAHFVIDTSRNGNGPTPDHQWCNPDGRALGNPPTANTGEPLCDAFLWLKRPGESDGSCNGGPKAGEWWPEAALGMAKRAPF